VPQGMTGLWQVSGRSALPYFSMLDIDLEYVDQWSMWTDLRILLKTPKSMCDWNKTA
jgi:lipopolysaccharide/colanic/teichoic acid biosynthesis glycosyltransferase